MTPTTTPADYHPATNGDKFAFSGTIGIVYDRSNQYPTPEPTQTSTFTVTQAIAVQRPATFNGDSNAIDFHTSETDQQTAPVSQSFASTIENYFKFSNTQYTGNFYNLGFTSVDDVNYAASVTYGSGNGLADILPEMTQSWLNNAAATVTTNDNNGQTSSQTINGNGSYVETVTYQNVGAMGPTNTATITSRIDQSGTYNTPRLGTNRASNYVYSVAAPTANGPGGTITATTMIPPAAGSTASPTPVKTTIPNWIPVAAGMPLATENDKETTGATIPAATCPVGSSPGGSNQIIASKQRVDPMLGEVETTNTTTYVIANVGPACVLISDVQKNYYDFSGQNGVGYFRGDVPQQTTTLTEVLYLTGEQLLSASRKPLARASIRRAMAIRIATAQAHIVALRSAQRSHALRKNDVLFGGHSTASRKRSIL